MTPREMQSAFELGVNRFDSDKMVESHIIYHWLNNAQDRIVKTRYSGVNAKRESFEETQKRTADLSNLVVQVSLATTTGGTDPSISGTGYKPYSFIADLPSDYFVAVGEEALITYDKSGVEETKRVNISPCTSDMYAKKVEDPYSLHKLHYESASPLRLFKDSTAELISDGNYTVPVYFLRYIKNPDEIQLDGDDCELPYHMHMEIVNTAVMLYLENSGDQRLQTNAQVLETQE